MPESYAGPTPDDGWRHAYSRRAFLRKNLAAGGVLVSSGAAASLLAACGGDDSDGPSTPSVTRADVDAATGTVNVLIWSFYENDQWAAGPVKPKYTPINSQPEVVTKSRQRGLFDIVDSSPNIMSQMFAIDRMLPIETDLLSNYDAIVADLRDNDAFRGEDGEVYAVPFALSDSMTAWNSDEVPEPVEIRDLLEPEYRGKIGVLDSPSVITFVAHGLLGMDDVSQMTHDDLEQIVAFLDELGPQVKTIYTFGSETDLLARGDIAVAFQTYGSLALGIQDEVPSIRTNHNSSASFVDALTILDGAEVPAALRWIDQVLTVPAQKAMAKASLSYPAVDAARSALPANMTRQSTEEILAEAPIARSFQVTEDGDLVTTDQVQKAWEDFKAGL